MQVTPSPHTHHMLRNWQFGWVREQVRQLQCGVGLHHTPTTHPPHTHHTPTTHPPHTHHTPTTHESRFRQLGCLGKGSGSCNVVPCRSASCQTTQCLLCVPPKQQVRGWRWGVCLPSAALGSTPHTWPPSCVPYAASLRRHSMCCLLYHPWDCQ